MNVINGLPAFFIAVHHHAKAFLAALFNSQTLSGKQNMAGQGFIVFGEVIEGADRLFWNDQKMHGRHRGNIVESEDLVIFIDDLRRYFPVDDLGEQSIHSCFSIVKVQGSVPRPSTWAIGLVDRAGNLAGQPAGAQAWAERQPTVAPPGNDDG